MFAYINYMGKQEIHKPPKKKEFKTLHILLLPSTKQACMLRNTFKYGRSIYNDTLAYLIRNPDNQEYRTPIGEFKYEKYLKQLINAKYPELKNPDCNFRLKYTVVYDALLNIVRACVIDYVNYKGRKLDRLDPIDEKDISFSYKLYNIPKRTLFNFKDSTIEYPVIGRMKFESSDEIFTDEVKRAKWSKSASIRCLVTYVDACGGYHCDICYEICI